MQWFPTFSSIRSPITCFNTLRTPPPPHLFLPAKTKNIYILSVYSLFSDRVGLPLHNTPFPGVLMKSFGAAFFDQMPFLMSTTIVHSNHSNVIVYSFVLSISFCLSNGPQFLLFYLLVIYVISRGAQGLQGAPVGKHCCNVCMI